MQSTLRKKPSSRGELQQFEGPRFSSGEGFVCTSAVFAKSETHSALASEPRDEGDDEFSTFDDGSWRGNKRRKLWKSACIHGALNVRENR